ncbi:DUF202 domain-containing protein [uncultured Marivita sp.]|uniref:YidH family protein n=1 Tax=uncultured Marivita sp. TaxID=888080 RepID=UPI0026116F1F|nr:DUF202 domain-containing protein [uncultured Marivita sp.]
MPDKNDMAEDRTDWAEARTMLANERTFAGWMRTGMASVALALGLRALFGPFEPTWIPKAVSTVFVVIAVVIFWAAWRNSSQTQKEMNAHETEPQSSRSIGLIAAVLAAGSIATGVILWLL